MRKSATFLFLITILCLFPVILSAIAITISIKDPDGAAVPGAEVVISGRTLTSNANEGAIALPDLPEGSYEVTVRKQGFETAQQRIEVKPGVPQTFTIQLKLAAQQTTIEVDTKRSSLANSDPYYHALRTALPTGNYAVENLQIQRDTGAFLFRSGRFSFLPPVLGKTVIAVFTGDGSFRLKPVLPADGNYLKAISGAPEVDETFRSAVLCFTDQTAEEIKKSAASVDAAAPNTLGAFQEFRNRARRRGDTPRSLTEALLGGENIANVDAELLAELYTPSRHSFRAYIHGVKHSDLRFLIADSGAIPHLPSPEETALVNLDPDGEHDGIWYMSHLRSEWENGTASSTENRHWVEPQAYKIETGIASEHLTGLCTVRFKVLSEGTRVIKFGLLPALRVKSVRQGTQEIPFIQEDRHADGSFYLILPEAAKAGTVAEVAIEYEGDKVVNNSGGGTFAVGARTSWYPALNSFTGRATYDLTFRVPSKYTLVSVGKLDKVTREQNSEVSHWVADVPLAVAGFNYGDFKKIEKKDDQTGYTIEVYATRDVPDYLSAAKNNMALSPASLAQNAMVDGMNSVRCFEAWFGKLPYGRVAITQQPQMNFGQSWPTLVYLPIISFLDSTQRWELFGKSAFKVGEFVDEVTPHEVSHQWWGHAVGWASYHDQWLSEGFADFSAALFLQLTGKQDEFLKYMERQRHRVIDKNNFGIRANDAGPLWMGIRLDTFKTPRAYNDLVYPKGAFVLQMLRSLMWDKDTQDKDFIAMMQDFVSAGFNKSVSTENFRTFATKHMKPSMDLAGEHNMNWFFNQWVYGTELPRYRLEYSLQPAEGGKFLLTGKVTQSDVSNGFRMKVPVYAELDKQNIVRLGSAAVLGNATSSEFKVILPKKPKRVAANMFDDVLAVETVNQEK